MPEFCYADGMAFRHRGLHQPLPCAGSLSLRHPLTRWRPWLIVIAAAAAHGQLLGAEPPMVSLSPAARGNLQLEVKPLEATDYWKVI